MFADAPAMDGPTEVLWDEDLARQSKAEYNRSRRRLGRPERLAKLRAALFERQDGKCHYCQRPMTEETRIAGRRPSDESATLEHLVSHAEGGETSEENCRAVCWLCNGLKGRLDQATRALEKSMQNGLPWEPHYYANRLSFALADWEARIASGIEAPSGVETGNTDSTEGESPVGDSRDAQ